MSDATAARPAAPEQLLADHATFGRRLRLVTAALRPLAEEAMVLRARRDVAYVNAAGAISRERWLPLGEEAFVDELLAAGGFGDALRQLEEIVDDIIAPPLLELDHRHQEPDGYGHKLQSWAEIGQP